MSENILNIAVVGAGYWGKNLVRNFATAKRCSLKYVCDLDKKLLAVQKKNFPFIVTTSNLEEVLSDTEIDAVVIATEVPTHFEIAQKSLEAGKHTYVEKPLTLKADDAKTLVELAKEKKLKLMVGHLLEYHPAVNFLKEMIDKGQLGQPYYIICIRSGLIWALFVKMRMHGGRWRRMIFRLSAIYSAPNRYRWRHTGSVICKKTLKMWFLPRLNLQTAK